MHFPPDAPKSDEPPSPDGPGPQPGVRGWLHSNWKLVAILVSIALLVAIGASSRYAFRRSSGPLPPPDGPWPQHGGFSVFLCDDDSPFESCEERAVTAAQKREIEARLRARPEVVAVSFQSRKQAYAMFLEMAEDDLRARNLVRAEDMDESFEGTLRPGDWNDFQQTLRELPGVANVVAGRESFWVGKAHVGVRLCDADSSGEPLKDEFGEAPSRCANHEGDATEEEKDEVFERLEALKGVDKIYFEDRAHSIKVSEHMLPGSSPRMAGESFVIKFKGGFDLQAVKDAVLNLPVVSGVGPVGP